MAEKRRSERIKLNVTIQVVGMQTGSAAAVAQPSQTIEVNNHGALIQARSRCEPGTELMIHNPQNLQNGLFKVVWSRPAGGVWNIAVEYQDGDASGFWGLK